MDSIIKSIRKERKMSGTEVADRIGISAQYYYDIEKGAKKLSADNAAKLAEIFGVSVDYLLGLKDEKNMIVEETEPYYALTNKDGSDIAKELEKLMSALDSNMSLAFHGETIDMNEGQRELLRISLENSMRVAKQIAKKKFTPKKYR
ncbi:transcriptional regulator with XRE-family HTH domain [Paenibacillus sp. DS2015]|uniref:helix-turn-helix domain-containing protein n=1 Tax=Paenibacillus sp. DS2015 TaxID=3373917 RepID=UPI003D207478